MAAFNYSAKNFVRIHCWPHAQRNIDQRINKVKCVAKRFKSKSDIENLQLAHSRDNFIMMCSWITKKCNWYEGIASGLPGSNKLLEETNKDIKDSFTFREGLPMNEFLELLFKIVRNGSTIN